MLGKSIITLKTASVCARLASIAIGISLLLLGTAYQPAAAATYASSCSSCHGSLASSERRGRSASQIRAAINADRGGMGSLRGLSNADLNGIARELGGSADLPEPAPSPSAEPSPSPSSSPNPSPSGEPSPSPPPGSCTGAGSSARPVVNEVPDQDASVGQTLNFEVKAFDCNDVPIIIKASKLKGGAMPSGGQNYDDTGLWTGRYSFTPVSSQANKAFNVTFRAVETEDGRLSSAPRKVRIRVFPAGSSSEDGAVTSVKVQSARWSGGKLLVKGKISFSKALNGGERSAVAAGGQISITDASGGTVLGTAPVAANGQWSMQASLDDSSVPCSVAAQFDNLASTPRTVKKAPGCSP